MAFSDHSGYKNLGHATIFNCLAGTFLMREWPFDFGRRIEVVTGVADFGSVGVENQSDATFASDTSGRYWVRKTKDNIGPEGIIAEVMGSLVGQALQVLAPSAAVYDASDDGETSWLSELVRSVGHWDPARGAIVTNPQSFGAMMVLDSLIMNSDRHWMNVLCRPDPDERRIRVFAIDNGAAVIGRPWDFARDPGFVSPPKAETRSMKIPDLEKNASAALALARNLERETLLEYAMEACWLASKGAEAVDVIVDALFARCGDAERIVNEFLEMLGGKQ